MMNNVVIKSNVMNSEVSTSVVSVDQRKSRLCLTIGFVTLPRRFRLGIVSDEEV